MPEKPKTTATTRTVVAFLLDRSGSMSVCRDATIEAFNAYLAGLRENPSGGERIEFTFLQFDTGSLDKICVAQSIADVADLTPATYVPRGGTPLIDAAYKTIEAVKVAVAEDPHAKVVICVQTDGEENSSAEHTWEALSALVRERTAAGWQFNFMGAGIDAYAQGSRMGIATEATMSYDHLDRGATNAAFTASASNTRAYGRGEVSHTLYSATQRSAAGDRFVPPNLGGVGSPSIGGTPGVPVAPVGSRPTVSRAPLDLTTPQVGSLQVGGGVGGAQPQRRPIVPDLVL